MVVYELDLSKLSVQQLIGLINVVNPNCGENESINLDCGLCDACRKECLERGAEDAITPCG